MSLPRLVSTEYYVQERSSNIEAQLAETTSQLHDFRLRQSQLESQNLLLELAVPSSPAGLPVSVPQQSLQAYVRKQARCLLDVDGNTELSHPSMTEIHQRGLEATAVLMCFSMCSPTNNGITHSLNMKDNTLFQENPSADTLAKLLVAIDFSNSQQEDMLHLRCLLYGKLGQLSRARAAIMDQLPAKV
ncbi:MAG: hypothetical protein FRX49_06743 [Trebouxia sp. A1-2]|nr:MAG: hypothetical protein FRX49_06743 [Trebouxia sp. A1-2]